MVHCCMLSHAALDSAKMNTTTRAITGLAVVELEAELSSVWCLPGPDCLGLALALFALALALRCISASALLALALALRLLGRFLVPCRVSGFPLGLEHQWNGEEELFRLTARSEGC